MTLSILIIIYWNFKKTFYNIRYVTYPYITCTCKRFHHQVHDIVQTFSGTLRTDNDFFSIKLHGNYYIYTTCLLKTTYLIKTTYYFVKRHNISLIKTHKRLSGFGRSFVLSGNLKKKPRNA